MTTTLDTARHAARSRRHRSPLRRLVGVDVALTVRDPLTLTFVFAFPVVTMLVIGGSFSADDADGFGGVLPSHWYVGPGTPAMHHCRSQAASLRHRQRWSNPSSTYVAAAA